MAAARAQNLLFILSDQHSRRALGCLGHPVVRTPNLDRLAAAGTLFRSAWCNSPICVPARAALHTGQYVFQTGYWDNGKPYEGSVPSWGHWLQGRGHRVESIGKLHFRDERDPTGFDLQTVPMHVVGGQGDLMGALRDGSGVHRKFRGYMEAAGPGESTYTRYDADITDRAVAWLEGVAREEPGQPWALFVSLVCPHPPMIAPPEFWAMYPPESVPWPRLHDLAGDALHPALRDIRRYLAVEDGVDADVVRRTTAAYLALTSYMDANVGRVLDALQTSGLADSTRVIYTSDHGEANGDRGIWGKCNMYEETLGVPLIMRGADLPAGAVVDTPVSHVDCFATVLDCLGIDAEASDASTPGRSLLDIAGGADRERLAFAEFHAASSSTAMFALRQGDWKYVHYLDYPDQLFDLAADPDEAHNLASEPAHLPQRRRMYDALRDLLDPVAVDRRVRADQAARVAMAGGRQAVRGKGTFGYTPAPGETPVFV